jgi:addiction module HigA family antidote
MEIGQYRLAKDISVPPRRINEIVHGKRSVTADTALRLARYFGTSDRFWLNLQTSCACWAPRRQPRKRLHASAGSRGALRSERNRSSRMR